jgi:rhodanese-related sulfurtransferase
VPEQAYAGDVSAREAWDMLSSEENAVLVDCRTTAEWSFVGIADLDSVGKAPVMAEWQSFPSMAVDPAFADALRDKGVTPESAVIFMCRSGVRSKAAAVEMTGHGYGRCYNLAGGFEGPLDESGHRGAVDGWKSADLPWRQS